jgi:KDO2-lipid IV(A) lauroyltransferase
MGLKAFIEDSAAIKTGLWLGKNISLTGLDHLAHFIGSVLALRRNSSLVRNISANQWVISGESMSKSQLQDRTRETIRNVVGSLAEYLYYYQHPEEGQKKIILSTKAEDTVRDISEKKVPTILLGPHLGNFDLFGMSLTWLGVKPYVLSYPNPNNAYKAQNRMREAVGMDVHPISFSTFREAKKALKEGYCVVTGLDRSLPDGEDAKYRPRFFGREAALPVFYTRLALETNAAVRVACGIRRENGDYFVDATDPIPMERRDDLVEESVLNVERVLQPTEEFIRGAQSQWCMLHPVWPEVLPVVEKLT